MPTNNYRPNRAIADLFRDLTEQDRRWSTPYDDPYTYRISYTQLDAAQERDTFSSAFRSYQAFADYVRSQAERTNQNYYRDDAIIAWNIIAYLKRRNVSDSHAMSRQYLVNLFQRIDFGTPSEIVNALSRVTRLFPSGHRPVTRLGDEDVFFNGFTIVTSVIRNEIVPVWAGVELSTVFNQSQAARPAPVTQEPPRTVMLPMPTILPEDMATREQVVRDLEAEKGRLEDSKTNLEQYKRNAAKYTENFEMIQSLFDYPLKEVMEFLSHNDYRTQWYGYDSGEDCNCAECRINFLRSRIHATKMGVDRLTNSVATYTTSVEELCKKLEEFSLEFETPAIFMPGMEFACDKLLSILCE